MGSSMVLLTVGIGYCVVGTCFADFLVVVAGPSWDESRCLIA